MFHVSEYTEIEAAVEDIVCKLDHNKWAADSFFLITTSTSRGDYEKPGTADIHGLYYPLLDQIRDLDSLEGVFKLVRSGQTTVFDFDNDKATTDLIYRPNSKVQANTLYAGEGVVVIYNDFACAPTQFPFVILKSGLVEKMRDAVIESLRVFRPDEDYTGRVTPGVYIEIDEMAGLDERAF